MKRIFIAVAVLMVALASQVFADDSDAPMHYKGGLGFHNVEAPVGVRWWLAGEKLGVDVGFGFSSKPATDDGYPNESLHDWALDLGVPMVMHSWPKFHMLFRPGLLYQSSEYTISDPTPPAEPFNTENATTMRISAEIEGEYFVATNFSVSASHGINFVTEDPGGTAKSQTSIGTFGNNFTQIGFHIYFFGAGH